MIVNLNSLKQITKVIVDNKGSHKSSTVLLRPDDYIVLEYCVECLETLIDLMYYSNSNIEQ